MPERTETADLVAYLAPEPDEHAVVSLLTVAGDEARRILKASIVIAPSEAATFNWREWQTRHQVVPRGAAEPASATYVTSAGQFRTHRLAADVSTMTSWFDGLAIHGMTAAVGPLPAASISVDRPTAPIRISPLLDTPASAFVSAAVRPGRAFFFKGQPIDMDFPMLWTDGDDQYVNSPLTAGLHCARGSASGLVITRLERRAWISGLRGGEDLATFDCQIGLDPQRIDVSELVLGLEEWTDDELVVAQQLKLDDIGVAHVRGGSSILVQLPTVGTRVQRTVRLYDLQGNLLDGSATRFGIVESINLSIGAMGEQSSTTLISRSVIGQRRPVPDLVERAEAVARVASQYLGLLTEGVEGSIVPAGADLRSELRARLAQARGVLRIVDRYFGQRIADWELLSNVQVPIEVLTSKGEAPPPDWSERCAVRWWKGGRPPFHGRSYLWSGGGLAVSSSPDGFGRELVFVTPLTEVQSAAGQAAFAAWWQAASPTR